MPRIPARALRAALALGVMGMALAAPAATAAAEGLADPADPVVIVGVGGLGWDDVDRRTTPTLWRLVGGGAVGSLPARTPGADACPVEAWGTVGAGRQVRTVEDFDAEPEGCAPLPDVVSTGPVAEGHGRAVVADWYGLLGSLPPQSPAPGELGARITAVGACAVAVGPGAGLALAGPDGVVDRYATTPSAAALAACPVTVIDAGALPTDPAQRHDALTDVDALLADVLDLRPAGARLLVAGMSETDPTAPGLQAVVEHPAPAGWLISRSTRYPGVVTLADLTATVLEAVGAEADDLDGAALEVDPGRRLATEQVVDNRRYLTEMSTTIPVMLPVMLAVAGLALVTAVIALVRRPSGPAARRAVTATLVMVAVLPAGAYLATLTRWWTAPAPAVGAAVSLAVATTVTALVAWGVSRRLAPGPWRVAGAVAAITWLVLTADALTGTSLQQGSLLGPIVTLGARFHGFGNVAFSVYAVSSLVLAATLAAAAQRRARPRLAVAAVATVGAVTVVVDGWPSLGADFGGVVALIPAFAVLLAHVLGRRASWPRVLGVAGVTVAAVAAVAVVDWARPGPGTHLGRFVQRVIDGEGLSVVGGKAAQAWQTVVAPGGAVLAVLVVATALMLVGPWRPAPLRAEHEREPLMRATATAIVVAAAVGTTMNDSGILVGAGVLGLTVAVLGASRAARWYDGPAAEAPGPHRPAALPSALLATGGLLAAAVLLGVALVPGTAAGGVARGGEPVATAPLVVVGTSGLDWSRVSPTTTPTLWGLVRDGAAAGGVTPGVTDAGRRCSAAGWLALSAGRPAVAGQVTDGWGCVPWALHPGADGSGQVLGWSTLLARQAESEFRPRLGALGQALADAGSCAVAVGPGAGLALAGTDGTVTAYQDLAAALADPVATFACPVTMIDVRPGGPGVGDNPILQDLALRRVLAVAPAEASVIVVDVGAADPAPPVLGVGVVTGDAAPGGHLTATSTRWTGVVRLLDVPTTILTALGVPEPADFSGSPLLATPGRPTVTTSAVDQLADLTTRDQALRGVSGTLTTAVLLAGLAALAVVVAAPRRPALRRAGERVALVLAAVPAGAFLMTTWQWWRFAPSSAAMWTALVLATATVAGGLALVSRRRAGPVVVAACAVVGLVLTVDGLLGTPLHRGSPFGPAVTLGGRFYGFGNPTYSLYTVAMVGLAAAAATAVAGLRRRRAWAVAATTTIGLVALVIDLWPTFGADVGGGLVLVPVFAVIVLSAAGARVTPWRLGGIGVVGVAVVAGIGVLDWLRPAAERTHLGRFVQSVVDGAAGQTVVRKAGYAAASLTTGPMAWLTVALLVALLLVMWRRGPVRAAWYTRLETAHPMLRPALWALLLAAVGGAVVNDYGVRIVTHMALALVPLLALMVARTDVPPAAGTGPLPCDEPGATGAGTRSGESAR